MKPPDRSVYRGLLILTGLFPLAGIMLVAFGLWTIAAVCGCLWMLSTVGLIHTQTRVLNAGARSLRDSFAVRGGVVIDDPQLLRRLDSIGEDLAMVRAHASAEPTQDEVRADLVQLAHSLRREVRLLQYSVTVSDEAQTMPAKTEPAV